MARDIAFRAQYNDTDLSFRPIPGMQYEEFTGPVHLKVFEHVDDLYFFY